MSAGLFGVPQGSLSRSPQPGLPPARSSGCDLVFSLGHLVERRGGERDGNTKFGCFDSKEGLIYPVRMMHD